MRHLNQKMLDGPIAAARKGRGLKFAMAAVGMAGFLAFQTPAAKAITQLEFLQWMVQLSGDNAQFSADSSSADYTQWARNKGMDPTGGWQPTAVLNAEQLAQALVQMYGLNPRKDGGNYFRILEREGIEISQHSGEVTRSALAGLVDEFGFQNRQSTIARASTTDKGSHGHKPPKPPKPPSHHKPPKDDHGNDNGDDHDGHDNHNHRTTNDR